MQRNLNTTLRRKVQVDPMRDFDALPPELRRWVTEARLPWSPRSVRKVWTRALARNAGNRDAALASLDNAEYATLTRDMQKIWGPAHPGLNRAQPSG